tara:strand:+ start:1900 stop:2148 length:249 start_codon:yes stop_codon:yes gene_type:complete
MREAGVRWNRSGLLSVLLFVLFVLLRNIGPDDLRALDKDARHPGYEGFDRRETLKACGHASASRLFSSLRSRKIRVEGGRSS